MKEITVDSLLEGLPKSVTYNDEVYELDLDLTSEREFEISYTCRNGGSLKWLECVAVSRYIGQAKKK